MADELRLDLPEQPGLATIYAVATIGKSVLQPDGTSSAISTGSWLSGKIAMPQAIAGVYFGTFPQNAPAGTYWITIRNGTGLGTDPQVGLGLMEWKGPSAGETSIQDISANAVGTLDVTDLTQ